MNLSRKDFLRVAGLTGGAVASGAAFASRASAGAPAVPHPAAAGGPIMSGDTFPIGLFWPPPPFQTTVKRYREIIDAGFTFSHSNNYLYADTQIQSYALGMADQVGLQVLVDDPDIRWLVGKFTIAGSGALNLTAEQATSVIQNVLNTYQLHSYWSIQDGRLLMNGGTGNGSVGLSKDGADWTDYSVACDVIPRQTGGGGSYAQAGIAFRATDPANAYVWLLGNSGTTGAPGYLTKAVFVNGAATSVTSVPLTIAVTAGTSYRVEIAVTGSTIKTSVNGTVIDTTTDSTYAKGRVGFREAGPESSFFDNVAVTDSTGKVLLSDDFSAGLGKWDPANAGGHASFAGFDIYDEPSDDKLATLGNAVGIVKTLAPDILPYVNLLPGFDGGAGYAKAAETIKPLELSFDRYPILASGEDTGYFQNWADVRAAGLKYNIPTWTYIQSVGYNGHAIPTAPDLLWQINISLAYGCKGIQYFTYWTPDPARGEGFTSALLTVDGRRTALYSAAKEVNNDYLARIGKVLLPLTSEQVQGANIASPPPGLPPFAADSHVASCGGDPVVLGRFTAAGATTRWLLVANYSRHGSATVRLGLGSAVAKVDSYDPSHDRWTAVSKSGLSLRLAAGEARLLRLTG
ncbi:MAG TPA: hypothetical protein VHX59_04815 [Mycobacteriales bacterium]|nr:hypothetical protein [Mycobacteriales bacterium]